MPIKTKNGIKNKILERVENTTAFSKENSKVKDKRFTTDMIPNMYCEKELVEAFRKEAKEKKWLYTTLMNEILRELYGKGNKKMKMISFCNKKGGVGKTTLCKNIAYKLALENKKVLVIDLDSQGTITLELQQDNTDIKKDNGENNCFCWRYKYW